MADPDAGSKRTVAQEVPARCKVCPAACGTTLSLDEHDRIVATMRSMSARSS